MRGLDRKIDLERKTVTLDAYGQEVETWTKLKTRLSATLRVISGSERFEAQQWIAMQQVEFRIRWSNAVADLNPLDRVIYPASSDAESPALEPQIYEILQVSEMGRREALQIIAGRRAEE